MQNNGSFTNILKLPALSGSDTYTSVVYSPKSIVVVKRSGANDTLAVFAGPKFSTTAVTMVPVPAPVKALAFAHNAAVYLLLADGNLATFVPGASSTLHIVGGLQIQPALPTGQPGQYTSATPVPTVPTSNVAFSAPMTQLPHFAAFDASPDGQQAPLATGTPTPVPQPTATPLPAGQDLAAGSGTTPIIGVADGKGHRIITLTPTGIDLSLMQQYADMSQLDSVTMLAFSPDQQTLYALTSTSIIQFALP